MKITFFNDRLTLNHLESEALKVALLDAWQITQEQRNRIKDDDTDNTQLPALVVKSTRLEALMKKMGVL